MSISTRPAEIHKIVWAFDPFEGKTRSKAALKAALKALSGGHGPKGGPWIEPVYVLTADELNLAHDLRNLRLEKYLPALKQRLNARLEQLAIPGLAPATIVIGETSSLRGSVSTLVGHAVRSNADLIVCETQALTGAMRFFLGSFTETLLLQSPVPVLSINPSAKGRPIRRILVPSDLSRRSAEAFDRAIGLAQATGASLTLLHVLTNPIEPIFQSGIYLIGGAWIPASEYLSAQEDEKRKVAEIWLEKAARAGVKARFILTCRPGNVKSAILEVAEKERAGLIALAAESGPIATHLLGSIARQVAREATCPVWILRSPEKVARTARKRSAPNLSHTGQRGNLRLI